MAIIGMTVIGESKIIRSFSDYWMTALTDTNSEDPEH